MKGFSSTWRAGLSIFVQHSSVAIKVNDDVGPYFQTKKGLRQGIMVFFYIVADILANLIKSAKEDGQISRLIPTLVGDRLPILQYADDTILLRIMICLN
jgi:hypothetical protein